MYLLDTNICIYINNNRPQHQNILNKFNKLRIRIGDLAISSITASELAFGAQKSTRKKQNIEKLNSFFKILEILPYDHRVTPHYARIRQDLESAGKTIGSLDMLIAAHAISLDMVLVTNNTKEFSRIAELKLENWV